MIFSTLKKILNHPILKALDRFATPKGNFSEDEWLLITKIKISIGLALFSMFMILVFAVGRFYQGLYSLGMTDLVIIFVLIPTIYFLKKNKRFFQPISFLFFLFFFLIICYTFFITDNIQAHILWYVSFLGLVFFLRDRTEGFVWLGIIVLFFVLVVPFSHTQMSILNFMTLFINLLFLSIIFYWYEILKAKDSQHLLHLNELLERKILERTLELQSITKAANQANEAKSNFVANMSHEIRTPLNAMQGFIELLKEKPLDTQSKNYLNIISTSGETLVEIINDILDFSKIESGKLDITPTTFNSREFFSHLSQLFYARSLEKNLFFSIAIDPKLPQYLICDPLRLKQVLSNLLSNAIKFTPKDGTIQLHVLYHQGELTLSVKDSGIGIPKEKQAKIFEAFSQADESTTRNYGGTGLGLAISYKLIQMLNGELRVNSQEGEGSEFYFTIAVKEGQKNSDDVEEILPESFNGNILLVEDNEPNQLFMSILLKSFGLHYTVAVDGLEAVMLTKMEHFDLILMDENMPNLNGIEATKRIRAYEAEHQRPRTPIVALTANALKGAREYFIEAGMDEYVTKPVKKVTLQKVFSRYLDSLKQNFAMINESEPNMTDKITALETLAQQIGVDTDMLQEVLSLFFTTMPKQIEEMKEALDQKDYETIHIISHTLKGTSANLQYAHISETAAEIEALAIAKVSEGYDALFNKLSIQLAHAKMQIHY